MENLTERVKNLETALSRQLEFNKKIELKYENLLKKLPTSKSNEDQLSTDSEVFQFFLLFKND